MFLFYFKIDEFSYWNLDWVYNSKSSFRKSVCHSKRNRSTMFGFDPRRKYSNYCWCCAKQFVSKTWSTTKGIQFIIYLTISKLILNFLPIWIKTIGSVMWWTIFNILGFDGDQRKAFKSIFQGEWSERSSKCRRPRYINIGKYLYYFQISFEFL